MRKKLFIALSLLFLLGSCSINEQEPIVGNEDGKTKGTPEEQMIEKLDPETVVPGVVYVKIKPQVAQKHCNGESRLLTATTAPSSIMKSLQSVEAKHAIGVEQMTVRYKKALKKYDLDLWYRIDLDSDADLEKVWYSLKENENFEEVSLIPRKCYYDRNVNIGAEIARVAKNEAFFNDPYLDKQWNLNNDIDMFDKGCDIRAFDAWKHETGRPEVIVGVVDGGIDINHEDLKDNLWVNTKEIPGNGIDDDGNGVVDDIHGVNACSVKRDKTTGEFKVWKDKAGNEVFAHGNITLDEDKKGIIGHGTHVAGIIAAKNNNGIGVCGIAGGDGTKDSGVRLISCEIFGHYKEGPGDNTVAFLYAMDNGAVILNNSWGYPLITDRFGIPDYNNYPKFTSPHIKYLSELIQFFNDFAGCDDKGNQLEDSPMKGGLVIFAAGNQPFEFKALPASLDNVISVASCGPTWQAASYTTYGDWVNITAPGGEFGFPGRKGEVFSTLPEKIGKYGYMAGTSMATPAVTGVAALIVSAHGGPGFTREDAKKILLSSICDIDINSESKNPIEKYHHKVGAGYIDAGKAIEINTGEAPDKPKIELIEVGSIFAEIGWKKSSRATIYHYKCETSGGEVIAQDKIDVRNLETGAPVTHKIENLKPETKYTVTVYCNDRFNNKSDVAKTEFTTLSNMPPVFDEVPEGPIRANSHFGTSFTVKVSDPDGHEITPSFEADNCVKMEKFEKGIIHFSIRPTEKTQVGEHKIKIILKDEKGATSSKTIKYSVLDYKKPKVITPLPDRIMLKTEKQTGVSLDNRFEYDPLADRSKIKIEAFVSDNDLEYVSANISDNNLIIKSNKIGSFEIKVKFNDGSKGGDVETSMRVFVVENMEELVFMTYPLEAKNEINCMIDPEIYNAKVYIRSALGAQVYKSVFNRKEKNEIVTIDLKDFIPGAYNLIVESNGKKSYKKMFIKL